MHISPGIIGLYWLAASIATAALWSLTANAVKAAARRCCGRCS